MSKVEISRSLIEIKYQLPDGPVISGHIAKIASILAGTSKENPVTINDMAVGLFGEDTPSIRNNIAVKLRYLKLRTEGTRFSIEDFLPEQDSSSHRRRKLFYSIILPEGETVAQTGKLDALLESRRSTQNQYIIEEAVVEFSEEEKKLKNLSRAGKDASIRRHAHEFARSFPDITPYQAVSHFRSALLKSRLNSEDRQKAVEVLAANIKRAEVLFEYVKTGRVKPVKRPTGYWR